MSDKLIEPMVFVQIFPGSETVVVLKDDAGCLIAIVIGHMTNSTSLDLFECFSGNVALIVVGDCNFFG